MEAIEQSWHNHSEYFMKVIKKPVSDTYRDKGSKFLGYLFPITDKDSFDDQLQDIKSRHPDATHHCYAWRYDPIRVEEFAQDDGEPGGTAGMPILNQMKSFDVINAGLVVVRYFGGTKLGKPGLIEAYGHTAALCLEKAEAEPIRLVWKVEINYPYSEQNTVEKLIRQYELSELSSEYMEDVTLILACPVQHAESLKKSLEQLTHLGIEAEFLEKSFI